MEFVLCIWGIPLSPSNLHDFDFRAERMKIDRALLLTNRDSISEAQIEIRYIGAIK